MNKAANIVSLTLLGEYHKVITLGKREFKIYQPTISEISRMFNGAGLSVNEGMKQLEVIAGMPDHLDEVCRTLAIATTIKRPVAERMTFEYIQRFATMEQIQEAIIILGSVIRGDEIFEYCNLDKSTGKDTAKILGNNSLIGQVATFMEQLHVSYKEATSELSFPLLLLMSIDKMRVDYGNGEAEPEVKKLSGKELMKMKGV
jgi:hypothetical protein